MAVPGLIALLRQNRGVGHQRSRGPWPGQVPGPWNQRLQPLCGAGGAGSEARSRCGPLPLAHLDCRVHRTEVLPLYPGPHQPRPVTLGQQRLQVHRAQFDLQSVGQDHPRCTRAQRSRSLGHGRRWRRRQAQQVVPLANLRISRFVVHVTATSHTICRRQGFPKYSQALSRNPSADRSPRERTRRLRLRCAENGRRRPVRRPHRGARAESPCCRSC